MADKTTIPARAEAQQVFRQFVWNLAGTLAGTKAQKPPAHRPRRVPSRKPAIAR